MRILLDTAPLLWLAVGDRSLSAAAWEAIRERDNEVLVSSVSAVEIAAKHALRKLPLPERPELLVPAIRAAYQLGSLPLDEESALKLSDLPSHHRDPFDRLLVCQAIVHGLLLLTPDEAIRRYPVRTAW